MTAAGGELWLVDLGMAAKVRPALVVSVPADDAGRHSAAGPFGPDSAQGR